MICRAVPGSLLTNILLGSLYGVVRSTVLTSVLTAVGSLFCYFMAAKTSPLFRHLMPRPLEILKSNIDKKAQNSADLFSYLLLMRLFPLLPYSALNIAGGVLGVPASPFFWTLVLGSVPFNAVTTQVGDILGALPADMAGGMNSIWTPQLALKLLTISVLSALPVLFKSQIQALLGGSSEKEDASGYARLDAEGIELSEELESAVKEKRRMERRMASIEGSCSSHEGDEADEVGDDSTLYELGEAVA